MSFKQAFDDEGEAREAMLTVIDKFEENRDTLEAVMKEINEQTEDKKVALMPKMMKTVQDILKEPLCEKGFHPDVGLMFAMMSLQNYGASCPAIGNALKALKEAMEGSVPNAATIETYRKALLPAVA